MTYVLFSSGLDSWCCLHEAILRCGIDNVRAIYFDLGQCYAQKEIAAAHELCEAVGVRLIIREDLNGLLTENRDTAEIPMRNLFLISAVAVIPHAKAVVFGMLHGEQPVDKTPRFMRMLTNLLRSQVGRRFQIQTPFRDMSKAQMLKEGAQRYSSVWRDKLGVTIGCHNATREPCGECMACFNRWAAFVIAEIIPVTCRPEPVAEWMLYRVRNQIFHMGMFGSWWAMTYAGLFRRMWEPAYALDKYTRTIYNLSLWQFCRRGTR